MLKKLQQRFWDGYGNLAARVFASLIRRLPLTARLRDRVSTPSPFDKFVLFSELDPMGGPRITQEVRIPASDIARIRVGLFDEFWVGFASDRVSYLLRRHTRTVWFASWCVAPVLCFWMAFFAMLLGDLPWSTIANAFGVLVLWPIWVFTTIFSCCLLFVADLFAMFSGRSARTGDAQPFFCKPPYPLKTFPAFDHYVEGVFNVRITELLRQKGLVSGLRTVVINNVSPVQPAVSECPKGASE